MCFDNIANNAAHKQLPERRDYQRDDSASVISSVNPDKLFFFQMEIQSRQIGSLFVAGIIKNKRMRSPSSRQIYLDYLNNTSGHSLIPIIT